MGRSWSAEAGTPWPRPPSPPSDGLVTSLFNWLAPRALWRHSGTQLGFWGWIPRDTLETLWESTWILGVDSQRHSGYTLWHSGHSLINVECLGCLHSVSIYLVHYLSACHVPRRVARGLRAPGDAGDASPPGQLPHGGGASWGEQISGRPGGQRREAPSRTHRPRP